MKRILFVLPLAILCMSCQKPANRVKAHEEVIVIDSSVDAIADTAYDSILRPFKEPMDEDLKVALGYTTDTMRAARPESNLLNWSADALLEMARVKTNQDVDLSIVNIGGLRCEWLPGAITFREVFELMPFNNELVVATYTGESIINLAKCCAAQGGQGIAGIRIVINPDSTLYSATIGTNEIVPQALYRVATSDYLLNGADDLNPLTEYVDVKHTQLLIRDMYIEYIERHPQVEGRVDGRTKYLP